MKTKTRNMEYELAEEIYKLYKKGELTSNFFVDCLNQDQFRTLQDKVSQSFKNNTLNEFKGSNSKKVNLLANHVLNSSRIFIFRARFTPYEYSERKAIFHRKTGALEYVLPEISPQEFKFYLIHELAHKYDEQVLYTSSWEFSNEETNKYLYNLAQENQLFFALSKADQEKVREYLLNGLRRGFLAEFKAWASTYRIYQEMREYDEIEPIGWVEEILAQQKEDENYLDFIFNYYQERFDRPEKKSLFVWPIYQSAYDIVVEELRGYENKCDLMDDLKVFIRECR